MRVTPGTGSGDRAALFTSVLAQPPTLDDVLSRLESYVAAYESRLSTVVAEERYAQTLQIRSGSRADLSTTRKQVLASDLVFLRLPASGEWMGFRDTFLVDEKPVRERQARLEHALSNGQPDALREAIRITGENTGATWATTCWCGRSMCPRWCWTCSIHATVSDSRSARLARTPSSISRCGRLISRSERGQASSRRRWVLTSWRAGRCGSILAAGAVLKTTLALNYMVRGQPTATITVAYRPDPTLGWLVPFDMHERDAYPYFTLSAVAEYRNLRQCWKTRCALVHSVAGKPNVMPLSCARNQKPWGNLFSCRHAVCEEVHALPAAQPIVRAERFQHRPEFVDLRIATERIQRAERARKTEEHRQLGSFAPRQRQRVPLVRKRRDRWSDRPSRRVVRDRTGLWYAT